MKQLVTANVHSVVSSPVGDLILVARDDALVGLYMAGQKYLPDDDQFGAQQCLPVFDVTQAQLDEYFAGERRHFELPLAPVGNEFRLSVWGELGRIPYGETRTYGQLAANLGEPQMAQAVGAANGRNPIAIIIPCHRVIGADGSLVGFAGGLERKRYLLEHEQKVVGTWSRLF